MTANHRDLALDHETVGSSFDDERGDPLAPLAGADTRHQDDEFGLPERG